LHNENACYYCIIDASDASIDEIDKNDKSYDAKLLGYFNALAREKYNLVKVSNYVNGSAVQQ